MIIPICPSVGGGWAGPWAGWVVATCAAAYVAIATAIAPAIHALRIKTSFDLNGGDAA
jgi:hypothetical protein